MELQKAFIGKVNTILEEVDFEKLLESANGQDQSYAMETLKQLHQAFVDTYGTDCITDRELGFIDVPAVIRGRKAGEVFLGLVTIDLESSGEHWNTQFIMEDGVVDQANCDKAARWNTEFFYRVGVYDYWYTPEIPGDIHVNLESIPHNVEALLRGCTGITPNKDIPVKSVMSEERKTEIIGNFLGWMLENQNDDDELYNTLHNVIGMSQEELNDLSIESLDHIFDQEQCGQMMG